MITRRNAARFAALVESGDASSGERPDTASYADLMAVVGALRAVSAPQADPAFVASLRERLVTEAESVLAEAAAARADQDDRLRLPPAAPRARRRNRRLAVLVSGAVLVGGTATVAVASQSALPGDGLYPVKRGLENAQAELTFDQAARGRLLLADASRRLDEAAELSRVQGGGSAQVAPTLDAFSQQAEQGSQLLVEDYRTTGDRSSITAVRTFTASSMAQLHDLQSAVPSDAVDQLLQAAQAVSQIQQTSTQACPTCTGPDLTSVPQVLTQSVGTATDRFRGVVPQGQQGVHALPRLPHVGGVLPPASVTDPGQPGPGETTTAPTAGEVQQTLHHLTTGLTDQQQPDLGTTVTDTTSNVLDAVGEVGNTVAGVLGDTVGGITSALPSGLPSLP